MKSILISLLTMIVVFSAAPVFSQDYTGEEVTVNITIPENEEDYQGELLRFLARGPENPIWSPDGKTIAFTGEIGAGIWTVPVEGGEPTLVYDNYRTFEYNGQTRTSQGSLYIQEFSADGSEILYGDFSQDEDHVREGEMDGHHIMSSIYPRMKLVDVATGETRIVRDGDAACNGGSMTSDGRYVVFDKWYLDEDGNAAVGGMHVYDMQTGDVRFLADGMCPDISPDDKYVIYTPLHPEESESRQIARIPLAGGEPESLTSFTKQDMIYDPIYVQYSPDGNWVLFIAAYRDYFDTSGFYKDPDTHYYGICVLNVNSGEVFMLSPNTSDLIRGYIRWSPDGTKFSYIVKFRGTEGNLSIFKSEIRYLGFNPSMFMKVTAVDEEVPSDFTILGNYPNPFNPTTTIEFSLLEAGNANLFIYNVMGQKVRELVTGRMSEGLHSVVWDGCDEQGISVSTGVYITQLRMGDKVATSRILLVR